MYFTMPYFILSPVCCNIDPPREYAGGDQPQEEETYIDQNVPALFSKPAFEAQHGYPYSEPEYEEMEYKDNQF